MSTVEAAKLYLSSGWYCVPIATRSKGPTIKGWHKLRITEPEAWFQPGDNIGIILGACSNLVCVDLDHPLAAELAPHFLPPTGLIAGRLGNPGCHWFYRAAAKSLKLKLPKKSGAEKLSVVEILSDGNQVVVGPSLHPDGERYDDLVGEPAECDGEQLTAAVRALHAAVLDSLGLTVELKETSDKIKDTYEKARKSNGSPSPGQDYDQRGDVRALLVKHGWTPLHVTGRNEHWRRPGKDWGTSATLQDSKLFYLFSSSTHLESNRCYCPFGLFAALERNGNYDLAADQLLQDGYGGLDGLDISGITDPQSVVEEEQEPSLSQASDESDFPADCLQVGGLLGEIVDFNLRTSLYPQPELALAGAIAFLGAITGRKVTDSFATRTNVYVLGLGLSGVGKEQARKVNKELSLRCGHEKLIGSERIGSHAGIVTAIHEQPACLLQLDEMGRLLETMKDPRKSPHLFNCVTVFMQLYSSSSTIWKADAYADAKKVKTIDQPHLCLYGTATPESFWRSLSTENISEGLIGRLLVFVGRGYTVELQEPDPFEPPEHLVESLRYWRAYQPGGNLSGEHPTPLVVPHSPDARARFLSHVRGINERRRGENNLRAAVWSRSGEKVAKLALIHACSRSRTEPAAIELEDLEWSIRLGNWLTRWLLLGCWEYLSENEVESRAKRVLGLLNGRGLTASQLTRRTQWLRTRERAEILHDLLSCGLIYSEQISTQGRSSTVFKRALKEA